MQTTVLKKLFWLTFYSLPLIAFAANRTEPRAQVVPAQTAQGPYLPVKVTIYKSRRAQLANLFRVPANPQDSRVNLRANPQAKPQSGRPTALEVKAYVQTEAVEHGVNPKLALWIVKHESEFNPRAKGDGEASRGLWQISKIYHPEVSDAMAFNVASSTEWSLERIRSGKASEWSTYRFCRTLYEDCPF